MDYLREVNLRNDSARVSGILIILGIIMMYWSTSSYMLLGSYARLGSLGLGYGSIILATILRIRGKLQIYGLFLVISVIYFSLLVMLTIIRDHQGMEDTKSKIFVFVSFSLFIMGFVVGREKHHLRVSGEARVFLVAAILALLFQLFFLKFMESLAFYGTVRKYGDTELNPVGVAYASGCLGMAFFSLGLYERVLWRKLCYVMVFGTVLLILLASGSRGATIWITLTLGILLILKFRRHRRKMRLFLLAVATAVFIGLVLFIMVRTNYAVSERLNILLLRFTSMFEHFETGKIGMDSSVSVREYMWQKYLSEPGNWFFFGEQYYSPYPHNQWLEIMVRFGLLGIPLLVTSLVVLVRLLFDLARGRWDHDEEFMIIAGIFLFSYFQSMTSLDLEMNRALMFGLGYFLGVFQGKGTAIRQPIFI